MSHQIGLKRVAAELELAKNAKLVSDNQGKVAIKKADGSAARVQAAAAVANNDVVIKSQLDAVEQAIAGDIAALQGRLSAGNGIDATALAADVLAVSLASNSGLKFVSGALSADLETEISSSSSTSNAPTARAVNDAIQANKITIHPDSAGFASIDGQNRLNIERILLSEVIQDTTSTTLAQAITSLGSRPVEQGDVLVLNAADPQLIYIHNGGTSGAAGDWTQLNTPGINTAQIRALISVATASQNALTYNSSTGELGFVANAESFSFTPDGLTVKGGGIKQSHIDFGTASNQVNAADLPVMAYAWAAISNPSNSQDALQKLDAAIASVVADVTSANTAIAGKAAQSDLTALQNRVTTAEGDIDALETGKADQTTVTALTTRVTAAEGDIDTLETSVAAVEAQLQSLKAVRYLATEFTGVGSFSLGNLPANARAMKFHVHLDVASVGGTVSIGTTGNAEEFAPASLFDVTVSGETQTELKISGKSGSVREMRLITSGVDSGTAGVAIVEYVLATT